MKTGINLIMAFIFGLSYLSTSQALAQEQRLYSNLQYQKENLLTSLEEREEVLSAIENLLIDFVADQDVTAAMADFLNIQQSHESSLRMDTSLLMNKPTSEKQQQELVLKTMNMLSNNYKNLIEEHIKDTQKVRQIWGAAEFQDERVQKLLTQSKENREQAMTQLTKLISQQHLNSTVQEALKGATTGAAVGGIVLFSALFLKAFALQVIAVFAFFAMAATVILAFAGFAALMVAGEGNAASFAAFSRSLHNFGLVGGGLGLSALAGAIVSGVAGYKVSKQKFSALEKMQKEVKSSLAETNSKSKQSFLEFTQAVP